MKRILVTGAAGFTGPYVGEVLSRGGHEVYGVVQPDSGALPAGFAHLHDADLTDADAVARVVSDVEPHQVVHLAAVAYVAHSDVGEMYRTNILGTRHLLEALAAQARGPDRVLIASSANVYGNRHDGIMRESMPPDPVNDYSVSKVAAEMVAGLYRSRLPICIVRPFNYTGVGQSTSFLIPKIVEHVRSGANSIRLGNLEVARDYSDVRFVANAYGRLLDCADAAGRTVNVSSGRAYRLAEILEIVAGISGRELKVEVDPALVRDNEVRSLWGDSSLLDQLIGATGRIPLEETLRWMLEA